MSLATKYRPVVWEDVYGQKSIVKILNKQIETGNIKNTYIFSGASGCGKTTVARLFINKVNNGCGTPLELDAASNSGVENIREIVRTAQERSVDSVYKAIIVDECHALSNQAWQAFLKCIEEPPKYTIFIFCTTEPTKIPDTIKNRCMRFNFNRIPSDLIYNRLTKIAELEGLVNYNETCDYISRTCNGEMRNAISLLEKCMDYSNDVNINNALMCIGDYSYETYFKLVNGIIDGNMGVVLNIVNTIYNSGANLTKFIDSLLDFVLDIIKFILYKDIKSTRLPSTLYNQLEFAVNFDNPQSYYFYILDNLLETQNMIKNNSNVKATIEIMFSKMCRLV